MKTVAFLFVIFSILFHFGVSSGSSGGNVSIFVENNEYFLNPSPYIQEGNTMVPLRTFFEIMDAKIKWCSEERAAFGYWNDKEVKISNGSRPKIDGEKVSTRVPAEIYEGSFFVPLRFIAEIFDYDISWNAEERAAMISAANNEQKEKLSALIKEHEGLEEREKSPEKANNDNEEAEKEKEENPNCYEPTGTFIWPVDGGEIVSEYGMRGSRFHYGLDIGATKGTHILASDSGKVVISGWESAGYGYSVVIKHDDYYTRYAHNSENLVSVGDQVKQGDVIAKMGSTGNAVCSHVHFEVRYGRTGDGNDDSHRDPLDYVSRD